MERATLSRGHLQDRRIELGGSFSFLFVSHRSFLDECDHKMQLRGRVAVSTYGKRDDGAALSL